MGGRFLFKLTAFAVAMAMVVLGAGVALAAELVTAELEGVHQEINVEAGKSKAFTISVHATGKIGCGDTAIATVADEYTLTKTGDASPVLTAVSQSPDLSFTGSGSGTNCDLTWAGAPSSIAVPALITVGANVPPADYTKVLSEAAQTTSVDNTGVSPGKLEDSTGTTLKFKVTTPTKSDQTITFSQPISPQPFGSSFEIRPTASSGLPVTVVATGGCTVSSGTVTMTSGTTSCTLSASQLGNDSFNAASNVERVVTAQKATSTTTVTCTGSPTYNGSAKTPCSATATGPGGLSETLTVTYTDNVNAGTATASASYGGNSNYTGDDDSTTFEIGKATSTTTVTCDSGPFYFTGSAFTPCSGSVTGVGGLNESVEVSYLNNVRKGTATADASYAGGSNHLPSSATRATFSILGWTLEGFFRPIDGNGVYNSVKGGHTVPLKFEVFTQSNELTDVSAVSSFRVVRADCASGAPTDTVEEFTTTGGTSLRYDTAGGQFVQNWKTPTGAGTCYEVTMTTRDGSSISADFKITK